MSINARDFQHVDYLWDDSKAQGLGELDLLVYRSNLLGADLRITNFAGGNTSAKITETDPLTGDPVEILWVKGSGGDLGTITREGFASLYLQTLHDLKKRYRGPESEAEMVGLYRHAIFNLNPKAPSIDTPMHAFIPARHVDHTHPDAIIAIATAENGPEVARRLWGDGCLWVPWQRPGFGLALAMAEALREKPKAELLILGHHGLFTWGETAHECYVRTLRAIEKASEFIEEKVRQRGDRVFGGPRFQSLPPDRRRQVALELLPFLRGEIGKTERRLYSFVDSDVVLQFVNSQQAKDLAQQGTSCPDHFLRTKVKPLLLLEDVGRLSLADLKQALVREMEAYRADYASYYESCRRPDSGPMRNPNPNVFLFPGLGMIASGKDRQTAQVTGEFFVNAINVMRGASTLSAYRGLPPQETFDIEYWSLEEAKLKRLPPEKELSRRVAVVTGGASGIGRAVAERFAASGAAVVIADIDAEKARSTASELCEKYGKWQAMAVHADVTQEEDVQKAIAEAVLRYGGLDILVSNAGFAISWPFSQTPLEDWEKQYAVLARGYFLVSREVVRVLEKQGLGGSLIFIASKNALMAGKNNAAYSTAKAAELHLARGLAEELGPSGIRVNSICPDAVINTSIWTPEWRERRAAQYGIAPDQLEEYYRRRNLLKVNIRPEDVAEAALFLASERSSRTTGCILTVDGGLPGAFPR